jgi:hypothetical protein
MNTKSTIFLALLGLSLLSCTSDSTSDLISLEPIPEQVGYAKDVKSIIDNNCISCHGSNPISGGNLSLTNYVQVRNSVLNDGLIQRMRLEEGNSLLMPQGGPKLPNTIVNIVQKWKDDGLQP